MQWNYDDLMTIKRLEHKGNGINNCCYVKTYKVTFSTDRNTWSEYPHELGDSSLANNNQLVSSVLPEDIVAKSFRIYPLTARDVFCMRLAMFGFAGGD